jgi:hypothetical protein
MGMQFEAGIPVNGNISIIYIRERGVFVSFYFIGFGTKVPRWPNYVRAHVNKIIIVVIKRIKL